MALWRVVVEGQVRWAVGEVEDGPQSLLPYGTSLDALLAGDGRALRAALRGPRDGPVGDGARLLAPIERQEVWAAGVTYERSRAARREETTMPDLYDQVYAADRPELFFKSPGPRVRAPGEPVGVRADSEWNVPEAEIGLVATAHGEVVGYVIGNDVTSRSIEGANALYMPQAKIYDGGCALGPCIVPLAEAPALPELTVELVVRRSGAPVVTASTSGAHLRRTPEELLGWLYRALAFPLGVILLTGTGIVPDPHFTLSEGDEVAITVAGLGTLTNPVLRVGRDA
jgi:2-dehydro-3-deoxy-D-arabinonate dehydratase